jgi:bacteriocin-like protein
MSASTARTAERDPRKAAPRASSHRGELNDDALAQVSGGTTAASKILKKVSDTASSIVSNLK